MGNVLIIGLLAVCVVLALRSSTTHFKGEGGCCGGGSDGKAAHKRLTKVVKERRVFVEGMTCEHCENRVEASLNALDGVAAKVNLKKKLALVSMKKDVADEALREAVEKAGYQVAEIRDVKG